MSEDEKEIAQKNTGIPYEQVTRAIFDRIVNIDPAIARNIEVLHNAKIKGRILTHQIDIYWKFEIGGTVHQVIVQAKDWGATIKQGRMMEFKGVLDDIPGQPRGIYVTRTGYQSGARIYADAHGIDLYILHPEKKVRPTIEMTHFGVANFTMKSVPPSETAPLGWVVEVTVYELELTKLTPRLSAETTNNNEAPRKIVTGSTEPAAKRDYDLSEISVYNEQDEYISSLQVALKPSYFKPKHTKERQGNMIHEFADPTYLRVPGRSERVRVHEISVDWRFNETQRTITPLDFNDVVSFILERVGQAGRRFFRFRALPEIGATRPEMEALAPRAIEMRNPRFRMS